MILIGRVHQGRLIVEAPSDLPDGAEVEVLVIDPAHWLARPDRAALRDALLQSQDEALIRARWIRKPR
jgi:hypothetical protein